MALVYGFISVITVWAAALLLARMARVRTRAAFWLTLAILLSTILVLQGYLLSWGRHLNSLAWWALAGVVTLALTALPLAFDPALRAVCLRKSEMPRDIEQRIAGADRGSFSVRLLFVLAVTVGLIAVINFIEVATLEPATPDAYQYHLARIIHYLQQGNLGYYAAGYWAQVVYPKVASVLQLYAFVVSGGDLLTQLVQFLAYFVSMLTVYGICRHLGQRRQSSAFAAFIFGILLICLLEASTAQNDMILTAFIGAALYFVFAYREWREAKYLMLAVTAFALAIGVKATFLVTLPPLALLAGYALFARPPISGKHLGIALIALALAGAVIVLPSGYWENVQRYHDPFGPRTVRAKYTQERKSAPKMAADGALNVLRYGVDFLTLDGWYPVPGAGRVQRVWEVLQCDVLTSLHLNLESPRGARPLFPFSYRKYIRANETLSSWGMLGFLLVWPVVWLVLLGRRYTPAMKLFAAASLVYYLVLCFIIPYDPFHGRFFTTGALFALPPLAAFFAGPHARGGRIYLAVVVALGCVNALVAASFRTGTALFPHRNYQGKPIPSVFTLSQSQLLLREIPDLNLFLFDIMVPSNAVVAIDVQPILPEYLFFGDKFQRRLITLRPFDGPRRPLPPEAQYLIYDATSPYYAPGLRLTPPSDPLGALYFRAVNSHPGGK